MSGTTVDSSNPPGIDKGRRTWIAITCGATAVGGVAVAVPFVSSFAPSERARAAGAPVQVDISAIKPGEKIGEHTLNSSHPRLSRMPSSA